jgi:hypothetical protein
MAASSTDWSAALPCCQAAAKPSPLPAAQEQHNASGDQQNTSCLV